MEHSIAQQYSEGIDPTTPNSPESFMSESRRKDCLAVVHRGIPGGAAVELELSVVEVKLLAQEEYGNKWLVTVVPVHKGTKDKSKPEHFVLREPRKDALPFHQIENEVAWLTFMAKYHPSVPVPKVYAYKLQETDSPFIALEHVQGEALSTIWKVYTEPEKWDVARSIADLVLDLGEIKFERIGGLKVDHKIGPTVQDIKFLNGRDKFHSPKNYDIGPYPSTRAYILACYDKEIYYYTQAPAHAIDPDLFDKTPRDKFIKTLRENRTRLAASKTTGLPEQPFVACHGSLQARKIIMDGTRISAVLDWEFAGAYPLGGVLGTEFGVLEADDEEDVEEDALWVGRIEKLMEERARKRGWKEERVTMMVDGGSVELKEAAREMFPSDAGHVLHIS